MAAITPDNPDLAVSRANREAIEGGPSRGLTVELPPGTIHLDRNVVIGPDSPFRELVGAGMDRTVLVNGFNTSDANRTLLVLGEGYQPKRGGGWDRDQDGKLVYGQSSRIANVWEGANEISLANVTTTDKNTPGLWVYVTSGIAAANELCGEWRQSNGRGGYADNLIRFDPPLRRSYAGPDAAVLFGDPVAGCAVRNLTIAQPIHPAGDPFFAKWAVNLWLDHVRIGLPSQQTSPFGLCCCGHVWLTNCKSDTQLGLNSVHNVSASDCVFASVVGEECCTDTNLYYVVADPAGRKLPGVHWYLGSDRLRLTGCTVRGAGAWVDLDHPGNGTHVSLSVSGRECVLRDVKVMKSAQHTPGYCGVGLSGDGLCVDGLRADVPAYVGPGAGMTLFGVRVPAWAVDDSASGLATNCPKFPGFAQEMA